MNNYQQRQQSMNPSISVERVSALSSQDLQDLCDATDNAIEAGGGFGWVKLPSREVLERYYNGVLTMPQRVLLVARLDGVICGSAQLLLPPRNNEAQAFAVQLMAHFVAPWARGYGLAKGLIEASEKEALAEGFAVINLDVRNSLTAAIQLYERMNYVRIGTHPFYAQVNGEIIEGSYYYKIINPDLLKAPEEI
jgi:ribosomal protein S18 acetylase RimI-like enzyme